MIAVRSFNVGNFIKRSYSIRSINMSAKDTAEQLIKDNKVMVFSKSYCPYCTKAKEELTKLTKFKAIELDNTNDGDDIQKALLDMTGHHYHHHYHIIITIIITIIISRSKDST